MAPAKLVFPSLSRISAIASFQVHVDSPDWLMSPIACPPNGSPGGPSSPQMLATLKK